MFLTGRNDNNERGLTSWSVFVGFVEVSVTIGEKCNTTRATMEVLVACFG